MRIRYKYDIIINLLFDYTKCPECGYLDHDLNRENAENPPLNLPRIENMQEIWYNINIIIRMDIGEAIDAYPYPIQLKRRKINEL